jgi:hypothetical protein
VSESHFLADWGGLCSTPASWDQSLLGGEREAKGSSVKKANCKKGKTASSRATLSKIAPLKKISVVKVVQPSAKPEPQGTSEIELTLAKPIGVSKFFCLLDIPASSHGPHHEGLTMTKVGECAAHVVAFDNLGNDSSSDVRGTLSPKRTGEKCLAPLPLKRG